MISELRQTRLHSKSPVKKSHRSIRICCNNFSEYEFLLNEIEESKRKKEICSPLHSCSTKGKDYLLSNRTKKSSVNNINSSTNPTQNQTKDNICSNNTKQNSEQENEIDLEIPLTSIPQSKKSKNQKKETNKEPLIKNKLKTAQNQKKITDKGATKSKQKNSFLFKKAIEPQKKFKNNLLIQSHSFTNNEIKNNFVIDRKTNKMIREKYKLEYLTSLSREHCNNKDSLQKEKETANKNYEINLKTLQGWVGIIKKNGFEKNEKSFQQKELKHSKLSNSVKVINNQISITNKAYRQYSGKDNKFYLEKLTHKEKYERMKQENEEIAKEISQIKKETPNYLPEIEKIKEETRIINEQIIIQTNSINTLKTSIQAENKKISEVTKEKEKILSSIYLMKKQNDVLKEKINLQYHKSTNFMLNVDQLLIEQRLYTNE